MAAVINTFMKNSVLKNTNAVKKFNLKELLPIAPVTEYHNALQLNETVSTKV